MDYQPFIHGDGKYRAEESQRNDLQRKGSYSPPKTMSLVLVDRIQTFWRGRWNNGVNMAYSFAPAWLSRAF